MSAKNTATVNHEEFICQRDGSSRLLTPLHPLPRDGLQSPVGTTNGSNHAGYGVRVTSQADGVGDQCLKGVTTTVQEGKDGTGNSLTCTEVQCSTLEE